MDRKPDGGPAFPTDVETEHGIDARYVSGMSLRDWFAGQAITSMPIAAAIEQKHIHRYAAVAYAMADAMLIERDQP